MGKWIEQAGPENDVVLSSRIRVARNFANIPFPPMMEDEHVSMVIENCNDSIVKGNERMRDSFKLIKFKDLEKLERQIYVEKHLASPNLLENSDKSALLLRDDEVVSIMLNEEDHIRVQCIYTGLELKKAWDLADKVDDLLEEKIDYAFMENFGYLTACPTNVGTGIRASVMLHLPGLVITDYIKSILNTVSKIGLAVRGLYGEGTEITGNLYQLSNQITLGQSEEEIVNNITIVAKQIIEKERAARDALYTKRKNELDDRVWRSYGILLNARVLTSDEFMRLISDVRMSIDLGINNELDVNTLNRLMFMVQPANLQKSAGRKLNPQERDIFRAETVRENLK